MEQSEPRTSGPPALTAEVGDEQLVRDLVLEYYIVNGNKRAAECFAAESGALPGRALDDIDCRVRINELISQGAIDGAVVLLNDFDAAILRDNHSLHFAIRKQQFVEILRREDSIKALHFAQAYLSPFADRSEEFALGSKKILSLLLFASSGDYPDSLAEYFNLEMRRKLVVDVNKAILKSLSHGTEPKLVQMLRILQQKQQEIGSKLPGFTPLMGFADS